MQSRPAVPSLYDRLGGDEAVRKLVDTFYDIVETDPEGEPVHRLHLGNFGMSHVRDAQFEFLCGFLGGPKYYVNRMGHSNLREMHGHLEFGPAEGKAWLTCMERAIDAIGTDTDLKARLMKGFRAAAEMLVVNQLKHRNESRDHGVMPGL